MPDAVLELTREQFDALNDMVYSLDDEGKFTTEKIHIARIPEGVQAILVDENDRHITVRWIMDGWLSI